MLIRFIIVSLSPPLSFFLLSILVSFFVVPACLFFDMSILRRRHPYVNYFPILQSQTVSEQVVFTHKHHSQYHKQFIVIIITTQHTYYYNYSSPSHWHFSFALSLHFNSPFSVATFEHYFDAWRFLFCNQSSAAITLIFDPTYFLFWYSTSQRNLPHYTNTISSDTIHPKKFSYSFN